MAQKPMLRAEKHAHAIRASQNRRKKVRREKDSRRSYILTNELPHVKILRPCNVVRRGEWLNSNSQLEALGQYKKNHDYE